MELGFETGHGLEFTLITTGGSGASKRHLCPLRRKLLVTESNNLPLSMASRSSESKQSACDAGDLGSVPGLVRSPGEGNGNPLQYSCLENPMEGGASMGSQRVRHD